MSQRIVLHIDRLVLRGIDRADAGAVSAAIQAELRRLVAVPGNIDAFTASSDRERLNAGSVRIGAGDGSRSLGRSVARQIVRGATR